MSIDKANGKSAITSEILRGLIKSVVTTPILITAILFISSGRLDWVMAGAYISIVVASQVITALILLQKSPELISERAEMKEDTKNWDKILAPLMALFGPVGMWIVAGLDMRFIWSPPIPLIFQINASVIAVLGSLLTTWAMASNKFFYGTVRIQKEQGHTVVTAGPYQYVRHPGYVGAIIFDLATPLILGSLWAFIPAMLTTYIIIVRTALEDRTLQDELDGYKDYAKRVRYRILPGIW